MNDLIIDNKEIFHVFDVTHDDDDQFVADILTRIKIISIDMILNSPKTVNTMMRIN